MTRRPPIGGAGAAVGLLVAIVLAGCASADDSPTVDGAGREAAAARDTDHAAKDGERDAGAKNDDRGCPIDRAPLDTVEAKLLVQDERVRVTGVRYPHPDYEGRPWSQWGQGLVAGGHFFSAIGNHCAPGGDAYVTRYDARASTLETLTDVLSVVDHRDTTWGYGKIHAPLVRGRGHLAYGATYWGTSRGLAYGDGYDGDVLLEIDTRTGAVRSLGVPVPKRGIPSLASWPEGGLLYGEAPDPAGGASGGAQRQAGDFFVYDVRSHRVVFRSDAEHAGYRSIMVDSRGRAYFSAGGGRMHVWDPTTKKLTDAPFELPGAFLRAATEPARDGTVYGVTSDPDVLFALRADGKIETLGPARGYTASLALDRSGRRIYYVPDAHGKSWRRGTPLVAVDTETGEDEVVIRLNPLTEQHFDLKAGGSYNVVADPGRDRVFVGLNASADDSGFGEVLLLVVDIR